MLSPFYFPHFLTHSFFFLLHLKFLDFSLLGTPHKEGMDSSDEFLLTTGYEPNAYDFKETLVESYTKLLDSVPLFSDKVSSADPDYDDAAREDMLHQAHRAPSSSMSDKTGRPVGERGDPLSKETRKHRSGLCSTNKKSKFLQSAKQELTNTNFKSLTTEEVY